MRRTTPLLLALGLSACGVAPPSPAGTAAEQAEPAIAIHPAAARPGDELAMQFADDSGPRGIAFSLDGWDGSAWQPLYYLTSDGQSAHREPAWWRVGEEGRGWDDVGVSGRGPDHVVVPPDVQPGDYRVCTTGGDAPVCGLLTIEE